MNSKRNTSLSSILIIPLIMLIFITSLYFLNVSRKSKMTTAWSKNRNMARRDSERKIELLLIDQGKNRDVFLDKALSYMKSFSDITTENIKIDKALLRPGDSKDRVYFNFFDKDSVKIRSRTEIGNITVMAGKNAKYTNPLFRKEEAIIYTSQLDYKQEKYFKKLLNNIEVYWDDRRFEPDINCYYYKGDDQLGATHEIENRRLIIYQARGDLELTTELDELEGIIYAEGNIYITGNFDFKGTIISKKGSLILREDSKLRNRGIVICKELIGPLGKLQGLEEDFTYNYNNILAYGKYFPGILYVDVEESFYE